MKVSKILSIPTLTASLLVLAGCTTAPTTNTNATVNANTEVTTNINEVVTNENTNVEQGSEVDTSDWLTYTNDEYGFSFEYSNLYTITESVRDGITYITPVSDDTTFNIQLIIAAEDSIDGESICGMTPSSEEEWNNIIMKKIIVVETTGPECNAPITGYVFVKDDIVYKVLFYKPDEFTKLHKYFLNSFQLHS